MSENTTNPESIETQVAAWSAERAEIAALAATADGVSVAGHAEGPKAGREAVHNTLMPIWKRRRAIDNREKELLEVPKQITAQIKKTAAELSAPLLAAEDRLRKDRDAYDAEQDRIKAQAAEAAKIKRQERINASVAVGIVPNLDQIDNATDEEWDTLIAEATAAQEAQKRAASISATLTALEDLCTPEEAAELTDAQAEHRIAVAQKAKNDRDEAERIKHEEGAAEQKRIADEAEAQRVAEQAEADRKRNEEIEIERAARAKLERGAERSRELALLGTYTDLQECAEWTVDQYAEAFAAAKEAKVTRDQEAAKQKAEAEQQAAELRRMQDAEAARKKADEDAQEAARKAQEAKDKAEREDAEQKAEATRLEALKPDIEKAQAWFEACKAAIPAIPDISDPTISAQLATARKAIREKIFEEDFLPF